MDAQKVHVPKERKSYLSTIYGKALDARAEHPILGDRYAEEAISRIDFDFAKLSVGGTRRSPCPCGPSASMTGPASSWALTLTRPCCT